MVMGLTARSYFIKKFQPLLSYSLRALSFAHYGITDQVYWRSLSNDKQPSRCNEAVADGRLWGINQYEFWHFLCNPLILWTASPHRGQRHQISGVSRCYSSLEERTFPHLINRQLKCQAVDSAPRHPDSVLGRHSNECG